MDDEQQKQFDRFVDESIACGKKGNGEPLKIYRYEDTQPWLVDLLERAGLDIDKYSHSITDDKINHFLNEHGNPENEKKRGNISITSEDIKKIPDIIYYPDLICIGIRKGNQDPDHIAYAKITNNSSDIYIERIFQGKKELRSTSRYKKLKPITKEKFKNILGMNKKTDISNAVVIEAKGIINKEEIKKAGLGDTGRHPE
jgi:hypothetical protein